MIVHLLHWESSFKTPCEHTLAKLPAKCMSYAPHIFSQALIYEVPKGMIWKETIESWRQAFRGLP